MEKNEDVKVLLDRSFTYDLDSSRKRTLPMGWKGQVPAGVADRIEAEGAGQRTDAEAESTGKKKTAPKKAASTGDTASVAETPRDDAAAIVADSES